MIPSSPVPEDRADFDAMIDVVYKELRRIAAAQLRNESANHTLQPTALVHEAYMRLVAWDGNLKVQSRTHFLAVAALAMRQLLVHHARKRNADKRGGGLRKVSLEDCLAFSRDGSPEVLAIDEALKDLAKTEPRKSRVIELRYFGGLSESEIAEYLEVSLSTVSRDIRLGLALLYRLLRSEDPNE
jgi:RNA polymerase sigma factor (TIGR02999 family)